MFQKGGAALVDGDLWIGGIATVHGTFTKYGNQYETTSATFVSCTGTKPAARTIVEKTFAEALSETKALKDGNNTYNYFKFDAYVTKNSGSDFYLTATKAEAISDTKTNTIQLYKVTDTGAVAKLGKNAKVQVTFLLKNYHGQAETTLAVTADQITVIEAGGTWEVVPEPAVQNVTLAEFIASTATDKTVKFHFSAQIKAFKDGATKDKYGNMTLTDGTNDLTVYGSTATATGLAWNDSDAYVFTNPQDFMTNTATKDLAVGDTVEVNFIRYVYNSKVQGQGIILSSSSGGGGHEEFALEYNIKASALGITADQASAVNYNIKDVNNENIINVSFASGVKVNTTYDEFGLAANATVTFKCVNAGYKIVKIVFDNYKYYNDCPMFAGEAVAETGGITGVKGTAENNHLPVTWDNLDGAAYTYQNTYTGNSWTYSFTVTIAAVE